jgi:hypothetical protein
VITAACARETRSPCGTTLERDRGRPKLQRRRIQRSRRAELAGFYNSVYGPEVPAPARGGAKPVARGERIAARAASVSTRSKRALVPLVGGYQA